MPTIPRQLRCAGQRKAETQHFTFTGWNFGIGFTLNKFIEFLLAIDLYLSLSALLRSRTGDWTEQTASKLEDYRWTEAAKSVHTAN